ncbi:MAG: sodium:solute symporter, partial [Planctomycetota bacterium]
MNLALIDWLIIGVTFAFIAGISYYTKRYTQSVSDFLTGSRCAGKYLLAVAEGAAMVGIVNIIASWEMYYHAGFTPLWWSELTGVLLMVFSLFGWIIYRYRATRVMTIAQLFELRYSRKFRVFSGILVWLSGVINYGIIPAVTAKCLIYLFGIPVHTVDVAGFEFNITVAIVMAIMLFIAVLIAITSGQIAVMVSDFFQGQLFNIAFLTIVICLLYKIGWETIIETIKQSPQGESMLNPFETAKGKDFNLWFFLIQIFIFAYSYKLWQAFQGYNCAAKSPHEARMATILGNWRLMVITLVLVSAPICTYVIMHNPQFAGLAAEIKTTVAHIADGKAMEQALISTTLIELLPVGVVGLLIASFLAATISSDDTYLHSWGSIFVQDVIMPFRKKPLTPQKHLKFLRISIIGTAVFAWIFGLIFPLREYLFMYFQITGSIFCGGGGIVLIGGLYWKRGTTAGAWAAMITGASIAFTGIFVRNIFWTFLPAIQQKYTGIIWLQKMPEEFPYNGVQMAFFGACCSIVLYFIVSFLTKPDPEFDMDRMLHRGKYAPDSDKQKTVTTKGLHKILGITNEFSKSDKVIY